MYLVDCLGWRLTLGQHNTAVPFSRLFVIRSTGELMNATTPTAYVGGEPLRAHLLKQYGIPMVDGLASVIVATTAMTIGQIVYILLGIGPGVWILFPHGPTDAGRVLSLAAVLSLALLLFRTALFLLSQRRGLKEPWSGLWCGLSKKDETILSGRQDSPRSSVPLDCRLDSSQRMGGEYTSQIAIPRNLSPDERSTTMTIPACKMITLFVAAATISGCLFWQGPLLSAPSSADDVAAHHNAAGIQAYKQKQWDRAKEHFEGAVKIAPSLAEAHYNLGMVLYRQGKDAEAKPHFLKAAALAPENDVIQNAPPFTKVGAPSRPREPSGISGGQGHSH